MVVGIANNTIARLMLLFNEYDVTATVVKNARPERSTRSVSWLPEARNRRS